MGQTESKPVTDFGQFLVDLVTNPEKTISGGVQTIGDTITNPNGILSPTNLVTTVKNIFEPNQAIQSTPQQSVEKTNPEMDYRNPEKSGPQIDYAGNTQTVLQGKKVWGD